MLSPLCLGLHATGALAALEPFTLGASETIKHESNINHATAGTTPSPIADWISTTEFTAALDEAVGRDKLIANAGVNYNAYRRHDDHHLDNWGYNAGAEFDWNTIGDIAGAFGADTSRKRYVYGTTSEPSFQIINGQITLVPATNELNMQNDSHVFGRIEIGGPSRWQIFGGADANRRTFSASDFRADDEHQWSANVGTRYATSPDLRFGLVGRYTRGEYPYAAATTFGGVVTSTQDVHFKTRSVDATVDLQATGNSAFDASLGYTTTSNERLSKDVRFVDGSLNWTWKPPSHFTFSLGLKRSSDVDTTSTGANTGVLGGNNLNGVSINNTALLDIAYALTAKISLDANAAYSQRKYSEFTDSLGNTAAGTVKTVDYGLYLRYEPTRNSSVSCGGSHERRSPNAAISSFLPGYSDNIVQCIASIKFD
jgi:hypothetical protein